MVVDDRVCSVQESNVGSAKRVLTQTAAIAFVPMMLSAGLYAEPIISTLATANTADYLSTSDRAVTSWRSLPCGPQLAVPPPANAAVGKPISTV